MTAEMFGVIVVGAFGGGALCGGFLVAWGAGLGAKLSAPAVQVVEKEPAQAVADALYFMGEGATPVTLDELRRQEEIRAAAERGFDGGTVLT